VGRVNGTYEQFLQGDSTNIQSLFSSISPVDNRVKQYLYDLNEVSNHDSTCNRNSVISILIYMKQKTSY
jgi:hypothetical protein